MDPEQVIVWSMVEFVLTKLSLHLYLADIQAGSFLCDRLPWLPFC